MEHCSRDLKAQVSSFFKAGHKGLGLSRSLPASTISIACSCASSHTVCSCLLLAYAQAQGQLGQGGMFSCAPHNNLLHCSCEETSADILPSMTSFLILCVCAHVRTVETWSGRQRLTSVTFVKLMFINFLMLCQASGCLNGASLFSRLGRGPDPKGTLTLQVHIRLSSESSSSSCAPTSRTTSSYSSDMTHQTVMQESFTHSCILQLGSEATSRHAMRGKARDISKVCC